MLLREDRRVVSFLDVPPDQAWISPRGLWARKSNSAVAVARARRFGGLPSSLLEGQPVRAIRERRAQLTAHLKTEPSEVMRLMRPTGFLAFPLDGDLKLEERLVLTGGKPSSWPACLVEGHRLGRLPRRLGARGVGRHSTRQAALIKPSLPSRRVDRRQRGEEATAGAVSVGSGRPGR